MAKPLFTGNKAESKAQSTDAAFRSITTAEAASRDAKTARLRELRMLKEAEQTVPAPEPKKTAARARKRK
jgi:hypothetical protein